MSIVVITNDLNSKGFGISDILYELLPHIYTLKDEGFSWAKIATIIKSGDFGINVSKKELANHYDIALDAFSYFLDLEIKRISQLPS